MKDPWAESLKLIGRRVNQQGFNTWFTPTTFHSFEQGLFTISVPNRFYSDWLCNQYLPIIQEAVGEVVKSPVEIRFVVNDAHGEALGVRNPVGEGRRVEGEKGGVAFPGLNPQYTFSSFVVGASNQFAHAASLAVAQQPAKAYNPLFLYGEVGLGKTHLMHAIGHYILSKHPRVALTYLSSEQFINELIGSIQRDRMAGFRNKYRTIDVLLVDDIQFLEGKDRTQEEFFHTFNTLYGAHKQIVVSSDRLPKEIPTLEERLRSRFEWGLIADLHPPDLETKVAILQKKADDRNIVLPPDVALFVASKIKSNIRELEGSLVRISAISSLTGEEISINLVKEVLKNMFYEQDRVIDIKAIQKCVVEFFGLKMADLKSKKRNKSITVPRQIAMHLCRKLTTASLPEIGREFGGKDHTTVIHSCRKIEALEREDIEMSSAIKAILKVLEL